MYRPNQACRQGYYYTLMNHAKPNHNKVLATKDTINIMKIRYGENCAKNFKQ